MVLSSCYVDKITTLQKDPSYVEMITTSIYQQRMISSRQHTELHFCHGKLHDRSAILRPLILLPN